MGVNPQTTEARYARGRDVGKHHYHFNLSIAPCYGVLQDFGKVSITTYENVIARYLLVLAESLSGASSSTYLAVHQK